MSIPLPRAAARAAARATLATVLLLSAAGTARAQCPARAVCSFGTDETGSASARAANVRAQAARAAFLERLTGAPTQSFDALADGTPTDVTLAFAGAGNATFSGSGNVASDLPSTDNGRYATSGSQYFEAITSPASIPTFTITFDRPVAAFGFYASDVGDVGAQLALQFGLVGGGTATWMLPYTATEGSNTLRDGSLLYAGYIGAVDFTSVTFLGSVDDDYIALDDVTVGARAQVTAQVAPEPATVALLASGLAVVAAATVRRRA